MRHFAVIGGAFAAVETALTIGTCIADSRVTLIAPKPDVASAPDLGHSRVFDHQIASDHPATSTQLATWGITHVASSVSAIDVDERIITIDDDHTIDADVIVVAEACDVRATCGLVPSSSADAALIRTRLAQIREQRHGHIRVHAPASTTWTLPAYECALQIDAWRRDNELRDSVDISLSTSDVSPCSLLHRSLSDHIRDELQRRDIDVAFASPDLSLSHHDDDVLEIDIGSVRAPRIPGLSTSRADGRFVVADDTSIAPSVHIIGDMTTFQITTPFSAAQQARHLARHYGGDLNTLRHAAPSVSISHLEFIVNLGDHALLCRTATPTFLRDGMLAAAPTMRRIPSAARPLLAGTLTHALILAPDHQRRLLAG